MFQSHSARNPLIGFESNHLLEQVYGILIHVLHMLIHGYTSPFWKSGLKVVVFQCFWPVMLIGSTLHRKYFEDLVYLRVSDEQSFSLGHLRENAANAPDVDGC